MGQAAPMHTVSAAAIRRLWPEDRSALGDHLLRLDSASRNDRFGGAVSDSFLLAYAENSFHLADVVHGGFIDGTLRAAGELRSVNANSGSSGPGTAEAAFSVETPFRRSGIGSALLSRVMRAASNRGINRVQVYCLASNAAMQALARKFETELRLDYDTIAGDLITRAPTTMTLWREAADTAMGNVNALLDWQKRVYRPSFIANADGR